MNEEFFNRQQLIRRNNELKKQTDVNTFIDANKKKVALDQRLEELSMNNNMIVSGSVIRKNILRSSASSATSLNNVVDTEVYESKKYEEDEEEKKKDNTPVNLGINKGKNIIDNIKNNKDSRSKFNKNI